MGKLLVGTVAGQLRIWGTTYSGGSSGFCPNTAGCGTVFRLCSPSTACDSSPTVWAETVLYSFCNGANCPDGANPFAGVIGFIASSGSRELAGTTVYGGVAGGCGGPGCGTVFTIKVTLGVGAQTNVYRFTNSPDGANPYAALATTTLGGQRYLIGTTEFGGNPGLGTAFAVNINTFAETVLYTFCQLSACADGAAPLANVVFDNNGNAYGTALYGPYGIGVVYKLTHSSGLTSESVLYRFGSLSLDGQIPTAGLTFDNSHNLYGTTLYGGSPSCFGSGAGCGTVFELTASSNYTTEIQLWPFAGSSDGEFPYAGVIFDTPYSGNSPGDPLYGVTEQGGTAGDGVAYSQP